MADDIYNVFQDLARMQSQGAADEAVPSYPVPPAMMADMRRRAEMYGAGTGDAPEGDIPVSYGEPVGPQPGGPSIPAAGGDQARGSYGALYKLAMEQAKQREARQQAMLDELKAQEAKYGEPYKMSNLDQAAALAKITGALLAPTRTGSFMESIGAAGTAAAGPLSEAAKAERERQDKLRQLQMARQKMALEMETGVPFDQMMKLEQLRMMQEKKEGPEIKDINLPDGSKISILYKDGKTYDLTGKPLDLSKIMAGATETPETRKEVAAATGIPVPETDPFASIANAKQREAARLKAMQDATKRLDKMDEESPASRLEENNRKIQRFLELNYENQGKTGPIVGMTPSISDAAQEMDTIGAELSRGMRQPGEGATSDYDARMFQKMTLSTKKDYTVNRNIGMGLQAFNRNEIERKQFMRDYLEQNRTLTNADRYWKMYSEANPILVKKDAKASDDLKNLEINRNRKSYQEWFREQMGRQPTPVTRGPNGELVVGER